MLQPPENLGLVIEPLGVLERDEARTDDLECDGAARVILLGLVDDAHAAFAADSQNAVAAERRGNGGRKGQSGADSRSGTQQEFGVTLGLGIEVEKFLDGETQRGVAVTLCVEEGRTPLGRQVGRLLEERLNGCGRWLGHVSRPT